ncbi:MAG: DUF4783 domain-containing protein [Saprospiraceae bacterium]|nr:DUF4783 domain-containing protein [Saprospiraceae bacterium]MBK7810597.1 DUF4783 domain-containing protein [Saprospiraceae bacterium]MBK9630189.1 DUF4783 domain-containing protein [Saprospiraceae bacterium]
MNKLIVVLWAILPFFAYSQAKHPVFEALSKSDASSLSNLLNAKVEYCYHGKIAYLDREDATKAIKVFMETNPPKSVNALHKGASRTNESQYQIAQYSSTNGKTFRVMIYSDSGSAAGIQEIKIDPQ